MEAIVYAMPSFTIEADQAQKTTLSFLKKHYPFSLLSRLFRQGKIRLNGKKAKKEDRLSPGDVVTMPETIQTSVARDRPLEIVFENPDFAVINKPAGIAVHSGKSVTEEASLIGQLSKAWQEKGITPNLLHRLDTMTSGCLIVAKGKTQVQEFERLFRNGQVEKQYLTIVKGIPEKMKGIMNTAIEAKDAKGVPRSQQALTSYEVTEVFPAADVSLVRAFPKTGRKHQVRIHLASIGHPLVMDHWYGDFEFNRKFQKKYRLKRFLLHAEKISFAIQGKNFSLSAPLPGAFKNTLVHLRMK